MDWNVSNPNKLTIRGGLVQSPAGTVFPITVYRGEYSPAKYYYLGDQISYNGSTYIFSSEVPQIGKTPTNTNYWDVSAEAGTDGVAGVTGPRWQNILHLDKYSYYSDGTNLYDTPRSDTKYIGISVNNTSRSESSYKRNYVWSRFKGEDGIDAQELYIEVISTELCLLQ